MIFLFFYAVRDFNHILNYSYLPYTKIMEFYKILKIQSKFCLCKYQEYI